MEISIITLSFHGLQGTLSGNGHVSASSIQPQVEANNFFVQPSNFILTRVRAHSRPLSKSSPWKHRDLPNCPFQSGSPFSKLVGRSLRSVSRVQSHTRQCLLFDSSSDSSKPVTGRLFITSLAVGTINVNSESATVFCNRQSQSHLSSVDSCKLGFTILLMAMLVSQDGDGFLVTLLDNARPSFAKLYNSHQRCHFCPNRRPRLLLPPGCPWQC